MVRVLLSQLAAYGFGTHSVCPDGHYDGGDDYQEVNTVPPESVLDVYRQTTTFDSRGLDVVGQLTA